MRRSSLPDKLLRATSLFSTPHRDSLRASQRIGRISRDSNLPSAKSAVATALLAGKAFTLTSRRLRLQQVILDLKECDSVNRLLDYRLRQIEMGRVDLS